MFMIQLIKRLKLKFMSWLTGEYSFERQWRVGKIGMGFQVILTAVIILCAKFANQKQIEVRFFIEKNNQFAIQVQQIHHTLQQINYKQQLLIRTYQTYQSNTIPIDQSKEYRTLLVSLTQLQTQIDRFKYDTDQFQQKYALSINDNQKNILFSAIQINKQLTQFIQYCNNYNILLIESNNNADHYLNLHIPVYQSIKSIFINLNTIVPNLSNKFTEQSHLLNSNIESNSNILLLSIIVFSIVSLFWNVTLLYLLSRHMRSNLILVRRITRLANADPLTGLLNRRALNIAFKTLTNSGMPYKKHKHLSNRYEDKHKHHVKFFGCLMLIDLDHFKQFNDTFGHVKGDDHLKQCAAIWKKNVRSKDFVARMGGEEFAILMPNCDELHATLTANRLQSIMPENTSFSAGIATFLPGDTFTAWYKRADKALYIAKQQGRRRAILYSQAVKVQLTQESIDESKKETVLLNTQLDTHLGTVLAAHLADSLNNNTTIIADKNKL